MTAPVSDLLDLKRRIEEAKGPDRDLDAALECAFEAWGRIPAFTGSIDAALALVERVLPGWGYTIEAAMPGLGVSVHLWPPRPTVDEGEEGEGPTPALALILALINALIAQQEPAHG
jgi:hypothetical protein